LADVVVTASEAAAEVLQREHALAKPPSVVHDAPLLAGAARSSRDLRAEVGVKRGTRLLVCRGTPGPDDGLETVVEALPFLCGVHVARIAGPKARVAHLWAMARSWGVEDRVHVVRGVSSQEMADYVSGADAAVLPGHPGFTEHETTLPPELFDYVQAGLPVVTGEAAVAVRDFVLGHGLGAVCRPRDPVSLALAVRELLTTVRQPATHAVLQQHSWEGQEPRLLGAYASLADRWPRLGALASHPGLDRQRASVA
jgi:glycosyltransferase involved in cell wall biosynthesis